MSAQRAAPLRLGPEWQHVIVTQLLLGNDLRTDTVAYLEHRVERPLRKRLLRPLIEALSMLEDVPEVELEVRLRREAHGGGSVVGGLKRVEYRLAVRRVWPPGEAAEP